MTPTAHLLLLRRPTDWSPPSMGLDYGIHRPTGTTALVCLRGSGSRAVMAEDGVSGLISCCVARSVVSCRSSKIGWRARSCVSARLTPRPCRGDLPTCHWAA
jgi:hypothetical protein